MCHTPINISEVLSYYNDGGDVVWDRGDYITAQRIHLDGDTTIADNIFEYEVWEAEAAATKEAKHEGKSRFLSNFPD